MKFNRLYKQYLKESKLNALKSFAFGQVYDYEILTTQKKLEEIFGLPKKYQDGHKEWIVDYPNNKFPLSLDYYWGDALLKNEPVSIGLYGDKNLQAENIQNLVNSFDGDLIFIYKGPKRKEFIPANVARSVKLFTDYIKSLPITPKHSLEESKLNAFKSFIDKEFEDQSFSIRQTLYVKREDLFQALGKPIKVLNWHWWPEPRNERARDLQRVYVHRFEIDGIKIETTSEQIDEKKDADDPETGYKMSIKLIPTLLYSAEQLKDMKTQSDILQKIFDKIPNAQIWHS